MADGDWCAQHDAGLSSHRIIHAAACRRAVVLASAPCLSGLDSARHAGDCGIGWSAFRPCGRI
jgi:hypothetical protein